MSQLVTFFRTRLTVCMTSLVLVCQSNGVAEIVAAPQDYSHATNIYQLRNAVSREQGRICAFELQGTVLAADPSSGTIFLQDDSGVAAIQMNSEGTLNPRQKIQLQGTNFIVNTDYCLSLGKYPVV